MTEAAPDDRRDAFEAALGGEYFALTGLRSSTTSEATTRASMFFTTLTGTLLALGFLASSPRAVVAVACGAVPMVALLGLLSYLRLVELAAVDLRAVQAIQTIRAYYRTLTPDAARFFTAPRPGQSVDTLLDTGEDRGLFRAALTIAVTVGLVDSLWIGAGAAFGLAELGLAIPAAVAIGGAGGLIVAAVLFAHQNRRLGYVVDTAPATASDSGTPVDG